MVMAMGMATMMMMMMMMMIMMMMAMMLSFFINVLWKTLETGSHNIVMQHSPV